MNRQSNIVTSASVCNKKNRHIKFVSNPLSEYLLLSQSFKSHTGCQRKLLWFTNKKMNSKNNNTYSRLCKIGEWFTQYSSPHGTQHHLTAQTAHPGQTGNRPSPLLTPCTWYEVVLKNRSAFQRLNLPQDTWDFLALTSPPLTHVSGSTKISCFFNVFKMCLNWKLFSPSWKFLPSRKWKYI